MIILRLILVFLTVVMLVFGPDVGMTDPRLVTMLLLTYLAQVGTVLAIFLS